MISNGALSHLIELRTRLLWVLAAIFLGACVSYGWKEHVLEIILQPVLSLTPHMVFTGVPDIFFTHLKVAVYMGILAGFPMLMLQIWAFIRPGLYKRERRILGALFLLVPFLLYGGAAFAHVYVLPLAVDFFFTFQTDNIHALPALQPVASFILKMTLAFALAFTLPLWVLLGVKLGFVQPKSLAKARRYVVVGCFVSAAILTPPDPASQLLLALPLYILFEMSLILSFFLDKK